MLLMDWTVFQAGISAEAEGYAGVLIDTVSDSGLRALRSRLTIPVVGPGEAAFMTAMMLGKRFSVLTMWDEWFPLYEKTLTEYGFWDRVASLRSIRTRPDVTELLAGKEEVIFDKLKAEAMAAINDDGADVIVLGSTTMHQSAAFLAANLPVPVINPGLVAYKHLEMLIELGLAHSKRAFPAPEVGKDADIRKGWG
jgi:allantoin racemase